MGSKSSEESGSREEGGAAVVPEADSAQTSTPESDAGNPTTPPMRGNARRRKRNRLVILLGVAATGLFGTIWASVSSSIVQQGQEYVAATLDNFRRGDEIRSLRAEVDQLTSDRDRAIAQAAIARTAFVIFAFHDRAFCFDSVRKWARDAGYPFVVEGSADSFVGRVTYFGDDFELRCVGAKFSDMTFLISAAPESDNIAHQDLHEELMRKFSNYDLYPAVVNPVDTGWRTSGPFIQVGWLNLDLPYSSFVAWNSGTTPPTVAAALTRPGTYAHLARRPDGGTNFIVNEPGASITLLNPKANAFSLQSPDGQWRPAAEVLAQNEVPAADRLVRTSIQVGIAAVLYGDTGANGQVQHYLGDDAIARLRGVPGVVATDPLHIVWQNW